MKVKRFDNIWTMGLIIFSAILVAFYAIKIVFPSIIIGVAEIPSIVAIGTFVDSHTWAFVIFNFIVSYIGGYIYSCACCRTSKLNLYQNIVLASFIAVSTIFNLFLTDLFAPFSYVTLVLMPFVMMIKDNKISEKSFISTAICFSVDIMAQAMSLTIRNIVILATSVNSATMTILMIDGLIWRVLLYCFFNYNKKGEK